MLRLLNPEDPNAPFPDPDEAETDPNGLLALGGDLLPQRLVNAYRRGIFPWYSAGQPILWWSPDPRTVLFPGRLQVSRSLRKTLRRRHFLASLDRAFDAVIDACAAPRSGATDTWILPEMATAYRELHRLGLAHSVEVWREERLVGGLYGVSLGRVFFGESMFSRVRDASKVALVYLVNRLRAWDYRLIDCQVYSEHLVSLGAEEISREQFIGLLEQSCAQPGHAGRWANEPVSYPLPPEAIGECPAP